MATFILTNSFKTIIESEKVKDELRAIGIVSVKSFTDAIISVRSA